MAYDGNRDPIYDHKQQRDAAWNISTPFATPPARG